MTAALCCTILLLPAYYYDDIDSIFKIESRKQWMLHHDKSSKLCGSRTANFKIDGKILNTNTESYKYGTSNSMEYVSKTIYHKNNEAKEDIHVLNSKYGFHLSRKSDGKLILEGIDNDVSTKYSLMLDGIDPRQVSSEFLRYYICTIPHTDVNLLRIDDKYSVIYRSFIKLTSGKYSVSAETRRINAKNIDENIKPVVSFEIILNPEYNWRIEKYKYIVKWSSTIDEYATGEILYSILPSGLIVPTSSKHAVYYSNDPKTVAEVLIEYHLGEEELLSESSFKLSAYGYQEPNWISNNSTTIPWFLYLSIAGIACLLLASFVLYRRGKRTAV